MLCQAVGLLFVVAWVAKVAVVANVMSCIADPCKVHCPPSQCCRPFPILQGIAFFVRSLPAGRADAVQAAVEAVAEPHEPSQVRGKLGGGLHWVSQWFRTGSALGWDCTVQAACPDLLAQARWPDSCSSPMQLTTMRLKAGGRRLEHVPPFNLCLCNRCPPLLCF